jgi:hypothetical protein
VDREDLRVAGSQREKIREVDDPDARIAPA